MSAIPKRKLTVEEYLTLERLAPFKSEFYDGEMFAMSGASYPHNRVKDNLVGGLHALLKGTSCFTMSSDMRVTVPGTPYYTYPDIVVVCGQPAMEDEGFDTLTNPRVIIEILSDSTEKYDRGFKRERYQTIEVLQEYVLVSQDEPRIEQHIRRDDGTWEAVTTGGLSNTLAFRSVAASIPLSDIYAGTPAAGAIS
jgi:Uma2 family endonuclease